MAKDNLGNALLNANHAKGGILAIGVKALSNFISRKMSKDYGDFIGAAITYISVPALAHNLVRDKELRDSMIISAKTLGMEQVIVSLCKELYDKTLVAMASAPTAEKKAALIKQAGIYGYILDTITPGLITVPKLELTETPSAKTDSGAMAINTTAGYDYGNVGGDNDPTVDLRASSGTTRY